MDKYITLALCLALTLPLAAEAQRQSNSRSNAATTKIISDDNPILTGDELGKPVDHWVNSEAHDFWHSDVFSESVYSVGQKLRPVVKSATSTLAPSRKACSEKCQPVFNLQPATDVHLGTNSRQALAPAVTSGRQVQDREQTIQR